MTTETLDVPVGLRPAPVDDASALARAAGLRAMGTRPPLGTYLKDIWERRHFVTGMSSANVIAATSQTRLGLAWELISPLLQALIFWLAFGVLLGARKGIDNFEVFLLIGVFLWSALQTSVVTGAGALPSNRGLIRSLHFPRAILPLSIVVRESITLLPKTLIVAGAMLLTRERPGWEAFEIIPALILLMVFSTGLALLCARMAAHSADIANTLPFLLRGWMYLSGVFFDVQQRLADTPEWLQEIAVNQPGAIYLGLARGALLEQYHTEPQQWVLGVVWALLFLVVGGLAFWWAEESYGEL